MSNPLSWLKSAGKAIYGVADKVVHFLGSSQVQSIEQKAATLASILFPADAPIIQGFQTIVGKIFQQAVVMETQFSNVENAGAQKGAAVVQAISADLDQWVANNFPGSQKISDLTKAGLVKAIADLQNDLTTPPTTPTPVQ